MICPTVFRLKMEIGVCRNEGEYYGRPPFFIVSVSELLFLSYPFLFEPLCFLSCVGVSIHVYLHDLGTQVKGSVRNTSVVACDGLKYYSINDVSRSPARTGYASIRDVCC